MSVNQETNHSQEESARNAHALIHSGEIVDDQQCPAKG